MLKDRIYGMIPLKARFSAYFYNHKVEKDEIFEALIVAQWKVSNTMFLNLWVFYGY